MLTMMLTMMQLELRRQQSHGRDVRMTSVRTLTSVYDQRLQRLKVCRCPAPVFRLPVKCVLQL